MWWYFLPFLIIPIVVHLFDFRKAKKIYFSSIKYITNLSSKTKSNYRLKYLLILTTRTLIVLSVIVFILSFAETKTIPNSVSVYFDNSGSSLVNDQGLIVEQFMRNSFDRGVKSISYFDNKQKKNLDKSLFEEVDFDIVNNTNSILSEIENSFTENLAEYNYIFSDFQASNPESVDYTFFDSSKVYNIVLTQDLNRMRNINVDTLSIQPSQKDISQQIITVSFEVWNAEEGNVIIKLMQGDRQFSSVVKEISELDEIQFDLPKTSTGSYEIVIDGDEVIYDNIFHFVIPKQEVPRVSIINTNDSKALNLIFDKKDLFDLNMQSINSLDYNKVKMNDLIILNSISFIPTSLLDQFRNTFFVVFPPDSIVIDSYDKFLGLHIIKAGTNQLTEIDIDYSHPLLQGVFTRNSKEVSLPKEYVFFDFEGDFEVIIKYRDGRPFLLRSGLIYFFNFILEGNETKFESHSLFLPIMYQIAFSSTKEVEPSYFYPNDLITISESVSDIPVRIKSNAYEVIPSFNSYGDRMVLEIPDDISAGKYYLLQGNDTLKEVAINISRTESIMRSAKIETWRKVFS
ncbi:MAG: BatA domain-containing protein, partial [Cyclobacteriaceae bacterium]